MLHVHVFNSSSSYHHHRCCYNHRESQQHPNQASQAINYLSPAVTLDGQAHVTTLLLEQRLFLSATKTTIRGSSFTVMIWMLMVMVSPLGHGYAALADRTETKLHQILLPAMDVLLQEGTDMVREQLAALHQRLARSLRITAAALLATAEPKESA